MGFALYSQTKERVKKRDNSRKKKTTVSQQSNADGHGRNCLFALRWTVLLLFSDSVQVYASTVQHHVDLGCLRERLPTWHLVHQVIPLGFSNPTEQLFNNEFILKFRRCCEVFSGGCWRSLCQPVSDHLLFFFFKEHWREVYILETSFVDHCHFLRENGLMKTSSWKAKGLRWGSVCAVIKSSRLLLGRFVRDGHRWRKKNNVRKRRLSRRFKTHLALPDSYKWWNEFNMLEKSR